MSRYQNSSLLTSIVAVGLDGEIGTNNELPWKLRSDLRFFKKTTARNIVIMGRKTFESIGSCLPNRENIILSHRAQLFQEHKGCRHAHSIAETLFLRQSCPNKDAFVIGGAQTYKQFASYVDRYLVTIVKSKFPQADAFFSTEILENYEDWDRREVPFERVDEPDADEFEFSIIELRHPSPEVVAARHAALIEEFRSKNHFLERKSFKKMTGSDLRMDGRWSFA